MKKTKEIAAFILLTAFAIPILQAQTPKNSKIYESRAAEINKLKDTITELKDSLVKLRAEYDTLENYKRLYEELCKNTKTEESNNRKLKLPWPQRDGGTEAIIVDSLQTLNDSIIELNGKIQQLQSQQLEVDSLRREIDYKNKLISGNIISQFGSNLADADNFFCRAVLESPLYYRYDSDLVNFSIEITKAMGYEERTNKFNYIYNVYYDLLVNYNSYNEELKRNINEIIDQFKMAPPDREFERKKFDDRLKMSEYYKVRGTGKHGKYRHIFYLDFRIEQLRDLFKSNETFKIEKFKEVLDRL